MLAVEFQVLSVERDVSGQVGPAERQSVGFVVVLHTGDMRQRDEELLRLLLTEERGKRSKVTPGDGSAVSKQKHCTHTQWQNRKHSSINSSPEKKPSRTELSMTCVRVIC